MVKHRYKNTGVDDDDEFLQEKLNSASDSVLGGFLKLSPGVRTAAKPLIARATTWISKHGSSVLATGIAGVAQFLGAKHPEKIHESSQKVLQYAIPFWEDIAMGTRTMKDHWSEIRKLGKNVAPFLPEKDRKLSGVVASKNEIIQYARGRITKNTKSNLVSMAVNLFERLPQIYTAHYDQEITKLAKQQPGFDTRYRREIDPDELLDHLKDAGNTVDLKKAERLIGKLGVAENWLTPGGSVVAAIAQDKGLGRGNEHDESSSVIAMIHDLKKQVDEMRGVGVENFDCVEPEQIASRIRQQVSEIFTVHQKNMERGDIPKRLHENFEAMVELVTQAIAEGDLSAGAMLALAGEGKLISTRGKKINSIASTGAIESEIRRMGEALPVDEVVDVDAYFKEAPFSKDELKKMLEETTGSERAFLMVCFDKPILRAIDCSDKEIHASHKKVTKEIYGLFKDRILAINALSSEDKKKLGITAEDEDKLAKLSTSLEEDNPKALKHMVRDPVAKRILANAALKGDKKVWAEVLKPRDEAEEKLAALSDDEIADEGKVRPSKRKPAKFSEREDMNKNAGRPYTRQANKDDEDSVERGM